MDYELAPESTYPAPLIQVGDAIKYLESITSKYPTMDLGKLVIGGDSAGAHIAANFALLESNKNISKALKINQVLKDPLIGTLLYCGPFDLNRFENMLGDNNNFMMSFLINQIGWSYFGQKN